MQMGGMCLPFYPPQLPRLCVLSFCCDISDCCGSSGRRKTSSSGDRLALQSEPGTRQTQCPLFARLFLALHRDLYPVCFFVQR